MKKNNFIKSLTPNNTKEIKPNLFIQEKKGKYRVVNPMAWKGKIRYKEQLQTVFSIRTLIWLGILLIITYGYLNDNSQLIEFYEEVTGDPLLYCENIIGVALQEGCTEDKETLGLCNVGVDKFLFDGSTISLP